MKVMYLVYSFTTGGTERLLVDICNEMSKNNEVFLYVVNNYYSSEMLKQVNKNVTIELENRTVGSKKIFETMSHISNFIKKNKIDIVHCNSLNSPELLLISKILNPKIRIFYTIHGMKQYKNLNKVKKIYRNLLCEKIIAISDAVKNDIIESGASRKKIIVVENAIDINKFKDVNLKKMDIDEPIIGNVARILPSIKGQDILIESINILKDKYPKIKCYFAGTVAQKNYTEFEILKKKVNENKLEKNIIFLGNVEKVDEFLKKINIFILPSRQEGFGISLIEAMCMGIPVISSDIPGPSDIVTSCKCGKIFKSENPQSLAEKIEEIIENYQNEKKISLGKVDKIKEYYNIANMCQKLKKIYGGKYAK